MAVMRIKFNYVRDYAVLYREDFIKYVGTILPKTIKRDHVNDVIVRCKRTASDPSKQTDIRPLLFDLLDNIATTKLPKGKCEFCDSGCGLYANGEEIVPVIVNDEGFVRNYAQGILTGLINKAIESSRSYGAFTIKEPEFDITIVVK